jgi:STE24 endopeptidase
MAEAERATQNWLELLSAHDVARAVAYTQGNHWILFAELTVTLFACAAISRMPIFRPAAKYTNWRNARPNGWAWLAALMFFVLLALLTFPLSVIVDWQRERALGLSQQGLADWLVQWALLASLSAVISAALFATLYWLMRRVRARWWVWATGLIATILVFITFLAPAVIEPRLNTYTVAPEGEVLASVNELSERAGISTGKVYIYDGSRQSERFTANVAGLFGTARIALSDTMFQQGASIAEVRAVVAHEIGHYIHHHVLLTILVYAVLAGVGLFLTDMVFRWVTKSRVGPQGASIEDPRYLPLLYAIFTVLAFLATPLTSTHSRLLENAADRFALELSQEPDGLASALIKTAAYRAPSPSRWEEFIFYSHPSIERRIRRAMLWKQENL